MDARSAALGTTVFAAVPATMGGAVPWLVGASARDAWATSTAGTVAGWLLVALGVVALAASFVRFARDGLGTPSPTAPTERLVVTGPYRFVRNPMYVAVLAVIVGQALLWRSVAVLAYAVLFVVAVTAFVALYEEPTLREAHGEEYARYVATVPRWLPRPGRVWPRGTGTSPHPRHGAGRHTCSGPRGRGPAPGPHDRGPAAHLAATDAPATRCRRPRGVCPATRGARVGCPP